MISQQKALELFLSQSEKENPELYSYKILATEHNAIPYPWFDFPAEDILIQCLRYDKTPEKIAISIITACKRVGGEFLYKLLALDRPALQDIMFFPLERLCRLIELAKPLELRSLTLSLIAAIKDLGENFPNLANSVFSAFSSYPQNESDALFWEEYIHVRKFAAFAFVRLVNINPYGLRLKKHLKELWEKHIEQDWDIDVAFLSMMLMNKAGMLSILVVMQSIKKENIGLFEKIKNNIFHRASVDLWLTPMKDLLQNVDQLLWQPQSPYGFERLMPRSAAIRLGTICNEKVPTPDLAPEDIPEYLNRISKLESQRNTRVINKLPC